jgi:hypothetical protein
MYDLSIALAIITGFLLISLSFLLVYSDQTTAEKNQCLFSDAMCKI